MEAGTPLLHARGFFFDLKSVQEGTGSSSDNGFRSDQSQHSGESGSNSNKRGPKRKSRHHNSQTSTRASSPVPTEWWEADTLHQNTGNKSTERAWPPRVLSGFKLDIPEHLPNSPLCPRNLLHKSGGSGICVYHGRKRSINLKRVGAETNDGEMEVKS
jgi:hypothetical protein